MLKYFTTSLRLVISLMWKGQKVHFLKMFASKIRTFDAICLKLCSIASSSVNDSADLSFSKSDTFHEYFFVEPEGAKVEAYVKLSLWTEWGESSTFNSSKFINFFI